MSFQHRLRLGLRRVGIDLARYPSNDPMFNVVQLLAHFWIDCVIDVGANSGGFASTIRSLGYSGRIVSLEPLSGPFEVLAARAAKDPDWEALRVAAGDADCEIEIKVARNAGHSSSVLAMLDTPADAAPGVTLRRHRDRAAAATGRAASQVRNWIRAPSLPEARCPGL